MQNDDPRYVRSRLALRAALLEIADESPGKLSVSAVCERSSVDRATFYRHFDDLDGLVEDALVSLSEEGASRWLRIAAGTGAQVEDSVQIMTAYFKGVTEHWHLYRWALGPRGSARVIHSFLNGSARGVTAELMLLRGASDDTPYRSWFMGGGFLGAMIQWLQHEEPEWEPERLARWILDTSMADSGRGLTTSGS